LGDWSGFNSINPQAGQNHSIVISVLVREKKLADGAVRGAACIYQ
jgi:hypothetical protein